MAGSIVTPGTQVKAGELWAGSPAKKVRDLTNDEIAYNKSMCMHTAELAAVHIVENSKSFEQILAEEQEAMEEDDGIAEMLLTRQPHESESIEGLGHPGRIFRSVFTHPEQYFDEKSKTFVENKSSKQSGKAA